MRRGGLVIVALLIAYSPTLGAVAGACDGAGNVCAGESEFWAGWESEAPGGSGNGQPASTSDSDIKVTYPLNCDDEACIPNPAYDCGPDEIYMILWVKNTQGIFVLWQQGCFPAGDTPNPEVTQAHVMAALRRVGLPALPVSTNPAAKTLVNLETVFYTSPATVTRSLTILGQSVLVEATPTSYLWHFGDGESASTDSPGAPYPAMDLTHRYAKAGVTVRASVDATYSARFKVNGGAWQDVDGTVTIRGSAIELRVQEATPVLSGER